MGEMKQMVPRAWSVVVRLYVGWWSVSGSQFSLSDSVPDTSPSLLRLTPLLSSPASQRVGPAPLPLM